MHEKAMSRMMEQIIEFLHGTKITDGKIDFENLWALSDGICTTALKTKKDWATESGLKTMIYNKIYSVVGTLDTKNKVLNGHLNDLLPPEKFSYLADDIKQFIVDIPRAYQIKLPMPAPPQDLTSDIELTQTMMLVIEHSVISALRQPLTVTLTGNNKKLSLVVNLEGFCDFSLDSVTPRRALTAYKVIIQQGIFRGLFRLNRNVPQSLLGLAGYGQHSIPKSSLTVIDLTANRASYEISFPISLCSLINKLEFVDNGQDTISSISRLLNQAAILVVSHKEGAERVRAAIEWLFDSMASDTDTLSFLQICFGLEALLGEGDSDQGLTKTLADRCAYLVANSVEQRRQIKERFRDLYQVRSNLVHGTSRQLNESEKVLYYWGKTTLECAIYREINNLKLTQ